jgi:diguanylate cyclase (GGDEF)-like protein
MSLFDNSVLSPQHGPMSAVEISEQAAVLHTILDYFPGGIAVFDSDLRLVTCNDKLKDMLQYPEDLFEYGMPTMEQIFRFNALRGEYGPGNIEYLVASRLNLARQREAHVYERKRPNGQMLQVRGVPLNNGGFLTIYMDISLQKGLPVEVTKQPGGAFDKLTGLPNATAMERHVDGLLRSMQHGEVACLHCIDLDHFSLVNKHYGTIVGDFVLKEIAVRLLNVTRGTDFLARMGGDRFQILQSRVLRPSDVTRLAIRMIEAIRLPIRCGDVNILTNASVGFLNLKDQKERSAAYIIEKANETVTAQKRKQRDVDAA